MPFQCCPFDPCCSDSVSRRHASSETMRPVHVSGCPVRDTPCRNVSALGLGSDFRVGGAVFRGAGSALPPSDKTDTTDKTSFGSIGSARKSTAPLPRFAASSHFDIIAPMQCRVHREKPLRPSALRVHGRFNRANAIAIFQKRQRRVEFGLVAKPRAVEP